MPRAPGRPRPDESLLVAKEPFLEAITDARRAASRVLSASDPVVTADDRSRAAEDAFFRVAVALETFVSEWVVRCVTFDSTRLRVTLEEKGANQAGSDLWQRWQPAKRIWMGVEGAQADLSLAISAKSLAKRPTLGQARKVLGLETDGGATNLTFFTWSDVEQRARETIAAPYVRRLDALTNVQRRVLDATIGIRNVVAHRSDKALRRMNDALLNQDLPAGLRRSPQRTVRAAGVGYYLRSSADGHPRYELFFAELESVAAILAPQSARVRAVAATAVAAGGGAAVVVRGE